MTALCLDEVTMIWFMDEVFASKVVPEYFLHLSIFFSIPFLNRPGRILWRHPCGIFGGAHRLLAGRNVFKTQRVTYLYEATSTAWYYPQLSACSPIAHTATFILSISPHSISFSFPFHFSSPVFSFFFLFLLSPSFPTSLHHLHSPPFLPPLSLVEWCTSTRCTFSSDGISGCRLEVDALQGLERFDEAVRECELHITFVKEKVRDSPQILHFLCGRCCDCDSYCDCDCYYGCVTFYNSRLQAYQKKLLYCLSCAWVSII